MQWLEVVIVLDWLLLLVMCEVHFGVCIYSYHHAWMNNAAGALLLFSLQQMTEYDA